MANYLEVSYLQVKILGASANPTTSRAGLERCQHRCKPRLLIASVPAVKPDLSEIAISGPQLLLVLPLNAHKLAAVHPQVVQKVVATVVDK